MSGVRREQKAPVGLFTGANIGALTGQQLPWHTMDTLPAMHQDAQVMLVFWMSVLAVTLALASVIYLGAVLDRYVD